MNSMQTDYYHPTPHVAALVLLIEHIPMQMEAAAAAAATKMKMDKIAQHLPPVQIMKIRNNNYNNGKAWRLLLALKSNLLSWKIGR